MARLSDRRCRGARDVRYDTIWPVNRVSHGKELQTPGLIFATLFYSQRIILQRVTFLASACGHVRILTHCVLGSCGECFSPTGRTAVVDLSNQCAPLYKQFLVKSTFNAGTWASRHELLP